VTEIRILFFNRWVGCHIGGTETHIKELALRLAKRGHEVHILTTQGDELKKYEGRIKTWYVSKNWGEPAYSRSMLQDLRLPIYALMFAIKALLKLAHLKFKGIKYDVISVHYALEAFIVNFAKFLLRTPYVFVFEGYSDLEAKIAKNASLKIAISKAISDKCKEKHGYRPLVIPVGVNRNRFKPEGTKIHLDRSVYRWVVLSVCRLDPKKNLPTLVQAARIVCSKRPGFLFLVVGRGTEKEKLQRLIEKYGLSENVILTGSVTDEELPAYYRSADLFISTEVTPDEFLITVVEAMASGLPVIVTAPTGTFEAVGDSGVVVAPNDPEILAEKIVDVSCNPHVHREMIRKSLMKAEEYDWEKLIIGYEKVYELAAKNARFSTPSGSS
jgi:glycosyltransferase involved in cell wall biosynthesis